MASERRTVGCDVVGDELPEKGPARRDGAKGPRGVRGVAAIAESARAAESSKKFFINVERE
jgi:hypothetical protein